MALLGGSRRNTSFGGSGLVATREDEERARQLEALWGQQPTLSDAVSPRGGMGGGGMLGSGSKPQQQFGLSSMLPTVATANQFEPQLPDFQVGERQQQPLQLPATPPQQRQLDPALQAMIGTAPVKKNNTLRDILASVAAVAGDTLAQRNGYRPTAVDNLTKQWGNRNTTFQQQVQDYQNRQRIANLPGMSVREMAAYMADPKAWGSHMADAATSRYQAATLNPGDVRYLGDGNGTYQAPTRGQQYAGSLGYTPGSEQWNAAIQDQELGAQGPTAFGNQQTLQTRRDAQAARMESQRQRGRMQMEGIRQGNRVATRGTPTYRDLNPPQRLNDIPTVRTPADVAKLPRGSQFRTPDGLIRRVP